MDGKVPVITATVSFGMGVDKASVRSDNYKMGEVFGPILYRYCMVPWVAHQTAETVIPRI